MKYIVNDDVVLSRPLEDHCRRTLVRLPSGPAIRGTRGLPGPASAARGVF